MVDLSAVEPTNVGEITIHKLKDSKFYALCRESDLLDDLKPSFETVFEIENALSIQYPRQIDNQDTRIFLTYINRRGNSAPFMISDVERLDANFNIDNFLVGYTKEMSDLIAEGDDLSKIKQLVLGVLTTALTVVLGIDGKTPEANEAGLFEMIFRNVISCIYDDPLDVFVIFRDKLDAESGEYIPSITNMWKIKAR